MSADLRSGHWTSPPSYHQPIRVVYAHCMKAVAVAITVFGLRALADHLSHSAALDDGHSNVGLTLKSAMKCRSCFVSDRRFNRLLRLAHVLDSMTVRSLCQAAARKRFALCRMAAEQFAGQAPPQGWPAFGYRFTYTVSQASSTVPWSSQ